MEDDRAIFKALLQLLVLDNIGKVLKKQRFNPNSPLQDSDEKEEEAFLLPMVRN
jgi:hypothetical protein